MIDHLKIRIERLERIYGSLRKAAKAIDIDQAYLYRLKSGEKTNPSDDVLDKLGLRKTIIYTLK